ncbi:ferrochelatase [Xylophilus sp.]|uniref:ferrochelatase n=1 Tax=Xylophilus sp. TaxID=2653893 RepID=UPI0013BC8528|nr:ferrochelatase [Xylophilus sp.]KAF1045029.1 MAG: Ferrochelatase [Xylophilus sp.]
MTLPDSTTGLLLCNLGTPDAPTPAALRRYLGQFLGDPRVVEIPPAVWKPLLHGVILRLRPARSAAKYRSIWTAEGSPLAVWTKKQAVRLGGWLDQSGHAVEVRDAMRYGQPAIAQQLDALVAAGARRILVLPLYPQYSGTTTASIYDAVGAWSRAQRDLPDLRIVARYHDHPAYIAALAQRIRAYWREHGRAPLLVMSFHGIPARNVALGDPYERECRRTGELLAQALELEPDQWKLTFQSRFGGARWLEPYTEPTLIALARGGLERVDVACPGFTGDCLETLAEIDQEARAAFLQAGGKQFGYIPCLNDSPGWIAALGHIALQQLAGWTTAAH